MVSLDEGEPPLSAPLSIMAMRGEMAASRDYIRWHKSGGSRKWLSEVLQGDSHVTPATAPAIRRSDLSQFGKRTNSYCSPRTNSIEIHDVLSTMNLYHGVSLTPRRFYFAVGCPIR